MKPLSENAIRARTSSKVWDRGEQYFEQGMVLSLVRRGEVLHARVEGSEEKPYAVNVRELPDGYVEAVCTCPFMEEWEGWCKHIVAALLHFAENRDDVPDEATVEELLRPLNSEALVRLLMQLVEYEPSLHEAVVELANGRQPSRHRDDDEEWD